MELQNGVILRGFRRSWLAVGEYRARKRDGETHMYYEVFFLLALRSCMYVCVSNAKFFARGISQACPVADM